jgi:hypothetical protein
MVKSFVAKKQKIPTIVATVEPENPNKLVDGYNTVEGDIINNVRKIRNDLITKMTANGIPRGAELEMTVSLLNDQESSAHKTATTRLRVKAEDTKAVVASSIIGFLFDEKNKNKDENGEIHLSIEDDYFPYPKLLAQQNIDIPYLTFSNDTHHTVRLT